MQYIALDALRKAPAGFQRAEEGVNGRGRSARGGGAARGGR
jgi:hypothetical protein